MRYIVEPHLTKGPVIINQHVVLDVFDLIGFTRASIKQDALCYNGIFYPKEGVCTALNGLLKHRNHVF